MAIMALLANMDDEDRIDLYELSQDLNWGSRKIPVTPPSHRSKQTSYYTTVKFAVQMELPLRF